jgi:hypothetical protein
MESRRRDSSQNSILAIGIAEKAERTIEDAARSLEKHRDIDAARARRIAIRSEVIGELHKHNYRDKLYTPASAPKASEPPAK